MSWIIAIMVIYTHRVWGQSPPTLPDTTQIDTLHEQITTQPIDTLQYAWSDTILYSEETYSEESIEIDGNVYSILVSEDDTLVLASLDDVSISSPRKFNNREEYLKYMRYKRYAAKVYPYAVEAVKLFKDLEYHTRDMKKKQRKRYIKNAQKAYKEKFEDPLKGLSKTQGKILVRMIERELETPMFNLIKKVKGKFTAFYWNQFSKLYGYRLKHGYIEGENPILDIVLQDFDIHYEAEGSEQD